MPVRAAEAHLALGHHAEAAHLALPGPDLALDVGVAVGLASLVLDLLLRHHHRLADLAALVGVVGGGEDQAEHGHVADEEHGLAGHHADDRGRLQLPGIGELRHDADHGPVGQHAEDADLHRALARFPEAGRAEQPLEALEQVELLEVGLQLLGRAGPAGLGQVAGDADAHHPEHERGDGGEVAGEALGKQLHAQVRVGLGDGVSHVPHEAAAEVGGAVERAPGQDRAGQDGCPGHQLLRLGDPSFPAGLLLSFWSWLLSLVGAAHAAPPRLGPAGFARQLVARTTGKAGSAEAAGAPCRRRATSLPFGSRARITGRRRRRR